MNFVRRWLSAMGFLMGALIVAMCIVAGVVMSVYYLEGWGVLLAVVVGFSAIGALIAWEDR